jgi:hypothetical protein
VPPKSVIRRRRRRVAGCPVPIRRKRSPDQLVLVVDPTRSARHHNCRGTAEETDAARGNLSRHDVERAGLAVSGSRS